MKSDQRAAARRHKFKGEGFLGTRVCQVCTATSVEPDDASCASCGSPFPVPVVRPKTNNPVTNQVKANFHEAQCVKCKGMHVARIWIKKPVCKPCWREANNR